MAQRLPFTSLTACLFVLCLSLSRFLLVSCAGNTEIDFTKPLEGTTEGLENKFLERCKEYFVDATFKKYKMWPEGADKDPNFCQDTWKIFKGAFAGKDICTVKPEAYKPYFDKTGKTPIVDKVLFWSGTFQLSGKYAKKGDVAVTLADTLTGYLVSSLSWCGDVNPTNKDGINYKECTRCKKNEKDETPEGFEVFWGLASEEFAKRAVGRVRHLVTCTGVQCDPREEPRPAFHKWTFFYKHELPKLNIDENGAEKKKVTFLQVILATQKGAQTLPEEHCGSGSLKALAEEIDKKGIKNECVENPKEIMDILNSLCKESPNESGCSLAKAKPDEPEPPTQPQRPALMRWARG